MNSDSWAIDDLARLSTSRPTAIPKLTTTRWLKRETTKTHATPAGCRLLPLVAALIAVLTAILLGLTAPASATVVAETRVGASDLAVGVLVEPPQSESPGQRLGNRVAGPGIAVATGVAANTGNRVFWSGGQPAKEAAEAFAKANGSKTLEMTAVGRTLEKLPYNRFTAKLWDAASTGFTVTARGNANVFIGPSFRGAGSTFGRIEGPILNFKGNPILQRFGDVW